MRELISIDNQKMNRNSWKHASSKLFDRSSSSSVFLRTKDCSGRETPLERTFFKDASNAPSIHGKSKTKPQKAAKHSNKSSLIGLTPQCSMTSTPKLSLVRSTKLKENNFTSIFAGRQVDTAVAEKKQRSRNDYKFIYQIGSGGFGSVWKVKEKQTNIIYAMKEISKAKVILKKSVASVINEKVLLDQLCSRFIINVNQSFQDRDYLYLAMEYLRGGDLRYHMCYHDYFSEEQAKFIVACIIISLEYIHSQKIIHRDLKPENLVFQENGYLRLTDFGVARKWVPNNASETSGTPGYMAPEVICRINHSFESDFFALGVIVFEMIVGQRPYTGDSRKQIRDKILAHQAKIVDENVPPSWNRNVLDFVNKLLKRTKQTRLGYNGIQQLKDHPWLSSINWKKLARQEIPAPFFPGIVSESAQYQREMESSLPTELDQETMMLLRTQEVQNLFKTYDQPKKKDSKNPFRKP